MRPGGGPACQRLDGMHTRNDSPLLREVQFVCRNPTTKHTVLLCVLQRQPQLLLPLAGGLTGSHGNGCTALVGKWAENAAQ